MQYRGYNPTLYHLVSLFFTPTSYVHPFILETKD